jgi:4-amino-4-deoxy-L-arabinose transferase-like glycosyltransferase
MNILNKKINIIVLISFLIKLIFVIFFHEKNLSDEWRVLVQNFENYKSYSYYIFNGKELPTSYMPPLYFLFIFLNKILSFGKINFLYLIYFNQVLISSITVYLFYNLCKNFFNEKISLLGSLIFSIFPLMIFSNGLISSACLQLFFYLLFFNLYLRILSNKFNYKNLLYLIFTSAFTLILRGEFLIIFLFSLIFLTFLKKKNFIYTILILFFTMMIISPYLIRNYVNTNKVHIVNVTGYALWKGNNQLAKVEGLHHSLDPQKRNVWPQIPEFENLYEKLDKIKKDKKYEISRDQIFKKEAINNILSDKKKYFLLYIKKNFSYFFIDLNSSIKNYYNPAHIIPILLFSICSIPGVFIGLKRSKNPKIIYLLLMTFILIGFISIFFILPRYKISIISSQILFSLFFFEYLIKNFKKRRSNNE